MRFSVTWCLSGPTMFICANYRELLGTTDQREFSRSSPSEWPLWQVISSVPYEDNSTASSREIVLWLGCRSM